MKILKLRKKDFKDTQYYWKEYCGKTDVSSFEGSIEIEGKLGYVRFAGRLSATGYIFAEAGSGIEAGEGIKAGSGIEAGWGIKAGSGIEAGEGIKAGSGIEAGGGIEAGLSIRCNLIISWVYNLFAGVATFKKAEGTDIEIEAKKLEGGTVAYGKFIKTKGEVNIMYWHIHHEKLMEYLTESLQNRIDYINENKPKDEIDLRLKLIKKVKVKPSNYPKTHEGWEELHKKECKNCPWNGHTIFPNK